MNDDDLTDEELEEMENSGDPSMRSRAARINLRRLVQSQSDEQLSDSALNAMLESEDEDLRERAYPIQRMRMIRKKVELDMGAESAAITGLVGAFLFGVGGITGWWLIPTAIGAIMFLGFVFSVPKRVVFKTFLFGLPALLIFGIGMLNKVQKLMNLF